MSKWMLVAAAVAFAAAVLAIVVFGAGGPDCTKHDVAALFTCP